MDRKMFIERYASKIATFVFCEASRHTTTGQLYVYFDLINSLFSYVEPKIDLPNDKELLKEIENCLYCYYGDFILDMEINDDAFDINLGTAFCCNDTDFEDDLWEDD